MFSPSHLLWTNGPSSPTLCQSGGRHRLLNVVTWMVLAHDWDHHLCLCLCATSATWSVRVRDCHLRLCPCLSIVAILKAPDRCCAATSGIWTALFLSPCLDLGLCLESRHRALSAISMVLVRASLQTAFAASTLHDCRG